MRRINKILFFGLSILLFLVSALNVSANPISYYNNIVFGYHFNSLSDAKGLYNLSKVGTVDAAADMNNISGQAFRFTNGFLYFNTTALNNNNDFSISLWFKNTSTSTVNYGLISKSILASGNGDWDLTHLEANTLTMREAGTDKKITDASINNATNYQHLVVTYVKGGNTCFYLNTVLENCTASTNVGITNGRFNIGAYYSSAFTAFGVYMDEVLFVNKTLNQSEVNETYATYDMWDSNISSGANINFISQSPSNITSNTLFLQTYANVVYNFTNTSNFVLSNASLSYSLSDAFSCYRLINGICFLFNNSFINNSNTLTSFANYSVLNVSFGENNIYPTIAREFVNSSDSSDSLTISNDLRAFSFKNFSLNNTYYIWESMINVSVGGLGKAYICNSSYTDGDFSLNESTATGGNPATSINCQEIYTFSSQNFSHIHSATNQHTVVAFFINNSRVNGNGITATSSMKFVIKRQAGTVYIYKLFDGSAILYQSSNNNGVTWSNIASYKINTHIHFYPMTSILNLNYFAQGYFNDTYNASSTTVEPIDFTAQTPFPPTIINPFNTNQTTRYMNISYLNATTFGTLQNYYNISLLNSDFSFNRSIKANNSLNLSYLWDVYSENLSLGNYSVEVCIVDSLNISSCDVESFTLINNALLNVTAFKSLNASYIQNFTLLVFDSINNISSNYSTTNGTIGLNVINPGNYVLNILAYNYTAGTIYKSISTSFDSITFYDFGIISCGNITNTTTLIIKYFDENNPSNPINASNNIQISTFNGVYSYNVSFSLTANTTHSLCLLSNITVNATIYSQYTSNYTNRYYIFNGVYNSSNQTIILYNWIVDTASLLRSVWRYTSTWNPISNVVVQLQRNYVGEGVWRTVQEDLTDNSGNAYFHIIQLNTDYKLVVYDINGSLIFTSDTYKFSCDIYNVCNLNVVIGGAKASVDLGSSVVVTPSYNNVTNILTINYVDSNGANNNVNVLVQTTNSTNTRTICSLNMTGSSGSSSCNVSGYYGVIKVSSYVNGYIVGGSTVDLASQTLGKLIGTRESSFWTFAISCVMVGAGFISPVVAIITITAAYVFVYLLGLFTPLTLLILTIISVISIVIAIKLRE